MEVVHLILLVRLGICRGSVDAPARVCKWLGLCASTHEPIHHLSSCLREHVKKPRDHSILLVSICNVNVQKRREIIADFA